MSFLGKLNIYVCEACRGHIVTRDLDDGTTPFMVDCRATEACRGMMKSSLYRVFDQSIAEGWHWYRPDAAERAGLSLAMRHHAEKGGLLLRKADAPVPVEPKPFGLVNRDGVLMSAKAAAAKDAGEPLSRQARRQAERMRRKPGSKGGGL